MANEIRVDVRSNLKQVLAKSASLPDRLIKQATFRALNRALDKSATETSREIRKVYNVRDRAVKAAMNKYRASRNNLTARLALQGVRIPLIEFDARWRPDMLAGATVRLKRGGARTPIAGAFIAAGRGGLQVFRRKHRSTPRLPIIALRGPSIPQQFTTKQVLEAVQKATHEAFVKNLEQQVVFLSRA